MRFSVILLLAILTEPASPQSGCNAPGIGTTPILTGRSGLTISGMKRVNDGSWTAAQFNMLNPFKMGAITPNIQNAVLQCAPPGSGRQGAGRMSGAVPPAVTSQVIVFGDLDGSGNQSAVIVSAPTVGGPAGSVTIYLADANFAPRGIQSFVTGRLPSSAVLADLNGDGKPDIVVSDLEASNAVGDQGDIAVLLNKGDGSFQPPVKYAAGNGPINVQVADVNGDGKPDIITADNAGNTVSVLLGNGNGTFAPAKSIAAGMAPQGVILADFNGDGKLDIAVGHDGGGIGVLIGNGSGGFAAPVNSTTGVGPWYLAAYDFDGDGKLDLAINHGFDAEVAILRGKGDGTFTPIGIYAVDAEPTSLVVTDFNNDGIPDLVVASGTPVLLGPDAGNKNMTFLIGNGDGTFRGASIYAAGNGTNSVAIADFNKDGKPDLIAANMFSPFVSYFRGNGNGTFASGINISLTAGGSALTANYVVAGDFNGDTKPDLAVGTSSGIAVALGNGDGTFQNAMTATLPGRVQQVVTGDFNGDGKLDLAVASAPGFAAGSPPGELSVLLGNGNGTFRNTTPLMGINAVSVAAGDLNADGKIDLVVADGGDLSTKKPGSVAILLGKGDGTFTAGAPILIGSPAGVPLGVTIGDVNGDGKPDVAVLYQSFNFTWGVQILLNQGSGGFTALAPMATDFGPVTALVSDFSGDGKPDLVIAHCCGDTDMTYLLGNGDGTFKPETHFIAGPSPNGLALGDLNGDGLPDIAVADNGQTGGVTVLLGVAIAKQPPPVTPPPQISANGVLNAASLVGGAVSPGEIVLINGSGLGSAQTSSPATPATVLAGTQALFDGVPAPLISVQANQVGAIVPYEVAGEDSTSLQIQYQGVKSNAVSIPVAGAAPGIFTLDSSGTGPAVAFNADSTPNSASNPASVGSSITFNATGEGQTDPPGVDGQIAGDSPPVPVQAVSAQIGGVDAPVVSAGGAPGMAAGFFQVTVQVPDGAPAGDAVPIVLTVGGVPSQPGVTVSIQPAQ
jgi:uncharacterized protein (TIGR03437 family)